MEPNYILKFDETCFIPQESKTSWISKIAGAVLVLLLVFSFIFRVNMFAKMSVAALVLLFWVIIKNFPSDEAVPFPVELRFYEDCLVIYREKHYAGKNKVWKEIAKYMYLDISDCKYLKNKSTKRIHIYGDFYLKRWKYNKDGSLQSAPIMDKTITKGMTFFSTMLTDVDVAGEIEAHSPIKVRIEG